MSNSPIFSQLVQEFADQGKKYDDFVRFATPAFRWSGPNYVVQLDKQKSGGVRIAKNLPVMTPVLSESSKRMVEQVVKGDEIQAETIRPASDFILYGDIDRAISDVTSDDAKSELLKRHKELTELVESSRRRIQEYIAQAQKNDDGSTTVVIEAVQPITPVMPISERDTAEPME